MLILGLNLLCVVVCVFLTMRSSQIGDACAYQSNMLKTMRGRLIANEHSIEALAAAHKKFVGKISKERALVEQPSPPAEEQQLFEDECENYRVAQIEGPLSQAASCECEFCVAKRAARRAVKNVLMPRTTADRLDAIKRGQES